MQKRIFKSDIMLFLAAFIWGSAFVAQKRGMLHMGPMTFTGLRFLLGALVLIPVLVYQNYLKIPARCSTRYLLLTAPLAGLALFAGASLQQIGLVTTTAGKAGFLTGIYITIVPVISVILRHKVPLSTWIGCLITFAGMYLLSVQKSFTIRPGDLYVLSSALFWAIHVQMIGYLVKRINPWHLAFVQFLTCSAASMIVAIFTEDISVNAVNDAGLSILYGGVMSVGIAFTLQVHSQQKVPPSHAAIIMSMEMVIAALAGYLILKETLNARQIAGCALMIAGVLAVQLAAIRRERKLKVIPL